MPYSRIAGASALAAVTLVAATLPASAEGVVRDVTGAAGGTAQGASAFAAPVVGADGVALPHAAATSLLDLFMQASLVVQAIMVGLVLASLWCWAIVWDKSRLYAKTRRQMDRFEDVFWSGGSLEDLYRTLSDRPQPGMATLFTAAMGEWKRSFERGARSAIGLQTRIDKTLDVALAREMERLEKQLMFLATLGSAAPFVGLFGTVVGIMTSFQAIAGSKSTNLAVVAPGIAEALLATALGLLAAIPAVIAYNKFSGDAAKLGARMEAFADEFSAILSRQVDEREGKAANANAARPAAAAATVAA